MKGRLNVWLLLTVLICGASYWFGKDLIAVESPMSAGVETPKVGFVDDEDQEATVHLLVLNGTDRPGLAREFGLLLGRAGCVADQVGNAPHNHFAKSFLVNRLLDASRIKRLAAELGDVPVLIEFDGRSAADAVLVLGRDADRIRKHLSERNTS